jgi:hypothetical protein
MPHAKAAIEATIDALFVAYRKRLSEATTVKRASCESLGSGTAVPAFGFVLDKLKFAPAARESHQPPARFVSARHNGPVEKKHSLHLQVPQSLFAVEFSTALQISA